MTPTPARLWHFTCSHSVESIRRIGQLRPHPHPLLPEPLVWLTDLEHAWREALGLTSHTLMCDRTAHRFEAADVTAAVWWPAYARQQRIPRHVRASFEDEPGVMPRHWWVSPIGVPIAAPPAPTPNDHEEQTA
jgi:hypothetical protein